MKYAIVHSKTFLKECVVGLVQITTNVINFFKSVGDCCFTIYQIEEEASEGPFGCKIISDKMILSNGKIYGIKEISNHSHEFGIFEPDGSFKALSTGWLRKTNLTVNGLKDYSSNAYLISSEKDFPKDWTVAVFNIEESTVDYGEIIPVQILRSVSK